MSIKGYNRFLPVILAAFMLSLPANASTSISLNEEENRLVGQGEVIVREVPASGKPGRTFEAVGRIDAPREVIIQVLTAYEKYPEFMPNVSRIDVVERRGNEAILNYTLSLPLGKLKKYRLKLSISEPEDSSSVIRWQLLNWPGLKVAETIKDTTGFWRLEKMDKKTSLVLYHVYTDPGPIAFGLGWIVDVLSKNSVPEALLQTKARAERFASSDNQAN